VVDAFQQAVLGRTRGLAQFKIVINAAKIEEEAFRLGLVKTSVDSTKVALAVDDVAIKTAKLRDAESKWASNSTQVHTAKDALVKSEQALAAARAGSVGQLTAEQKQLAILNLILDQSAGMHKKAAGMSHTYTVEMAALRAEAKDFEEKLGEALLPTITHVVTEMADWLKSTDNQQRLLGFLKTGVDDVKTGVDDLWPVVKVVAHWLNNAADATGGWNHFVEILLAFKMASVLGNWALAIEKLIGAEAAGTGIAGAAGAAGLLRSRLLLFGAMAPVVLPILFPEQTLSAMDWLDHHVPGAEWLAKHVPGFSLQSHDAPNVNGTKGQLRAMGYKVTPGPDSAPATRADLQMAGLLPAGPAAGGYPASGAAGPHATPTGPHYPLAHSGSIIGTPGSGTHSRSEGSGPGGYLWQDDDAVDIEMTPGEAVVAVESGVIGNDLKYGGDSGRYSGWGFMLLGDSGASYYYKHLRGVTIKEGQRVKAGQVLGYGTTTGHLHFAKKGAQDAAQVLGTSPVPGGGPPAAKTTAKSAGGGGPPPSLTVGTKTTPPIIPVALQTRLLEAEDALTRDPTRANMEAAIRVLDDERKLLLAKLKKPGLTGQQRHDIQAELNGVDSQIAGIHGQIVDAIKAERKLIASQRQHVALAMAAAKAMGVPTETSGIDAMGAIQFYLSRSDEQNKRVAANAQKLRNTIAKATAEGKAEGKSIGAEILSLDPSTVATFTDQFGRVIKQITVGQMQVTWSAAMAVLADPAHTKAQVDAAIKTLDSLVGPLQQAANSAAQNLAASQQGTSLLEGLLGLRDDQLVEIKDRWGRVIQTMNVGQLRAELEADLADLTSGVASKVANAIADIGRLDPVVQGLFDKAAQDALDNLQKIKEAVIAADQAIVDADQKAVDAAQSAADQARSDFERELSRGFDLGMQVFDAKTAELLKHVRASVTVLGRTFSIAIGEQTPAEKLLAALTASHDTSQLGNAVNEAQSKLDEAKKYGTPADVAAAQKALDDALYQQKVADLQTQATAERTAADKALQDKQDALTRERQAIKDNLQLEYDDLTRAFERGEISADEYQQRTIDMLNSHGAGFAAAGKLLGSAFADEMSGAFGRASTASRTLADDLVVLANATNALADATRNLKAAQADQPAPPPTPAVDTSGWTQPPNPNPPPRGGPPIAFARGGKVPGIYINREDTIASRLTPGEHVTDRKLTRAMEDFYYGGGGGDGAGGGGAQHVHLHLEGGVWPGTKEQFARILARRLDAHFAPGRRRIGMREM
jgi:peptidase M23-like protein